MRLNRPGDAPQVRVIEVASRLVGAARTSRRIRRSSQASKAAAPLTGAGGAILAVGGVLATARPRPCLSTFILGGVGVFLLLILLGAASQTARMPTVPPRNPRRARIREINAPAGRRSR
jgi:hypothetical protein